MSPVHAEAAETIAVAVAVFMMFSFNKFGVQFFVFTYIAAACRLLLFFIEIVFRWLYCI